MDHNAQKWTLGYAPFFLCAMIALLISLPKAQTIPMHQEACDAQGCYRQEFVAGWGLKPKRIYSLQYDGSKVCSTILDALNSTLAQKKAPINSDGNASNSLFINPIFIQWKFISGDPVSGSLPFYMTDYTKFRWTIVPYMNDGHKYLFSNVGGLWNVPEDHLSENWNDSETWKKYSILPLAIKNDFNDSKLPKLKKISGKYPSPWDHFDRKNTGLEFAIINNQYYTILADPDDMMVVTYVDGIGKNDLCYIQSTISNAIKSVR